MKMSMELLMVPGMDNAKKLHEVRMESRERAIRNFRTQQQTRHTAARSAVTLAVRS